MYVNCVAPFVQSVADVRSPILSKTKDGTVSNNNQKRESPLGQEKMISQKPTHLSEEEKREKDSP